MTKILKRWALLIGAAAMGFALAGCGGSNDSSSSASVRLANATLTHASLDLLANSSTVSTATATDAIGTYVGVTSGVNIPLQINDSGSGTALATTVKSLTGGNHYALVAYESSGAVKTALISEDYPVPPANTAQLRIYNAAPEAGNLDIYITDPAADLSTGSPITMAAGGATIAGPTTYGPGTYRVRVTGAGNKSDLRLDIPAVALTNQQVGMIILTPASGGVLLNGATLIQQLSYSAVRNGNVRVRLAAAVSGGASVAASAGNVVIEAGSVAPSYGFYSLVPANTLLNISVGGNSVGAPPAAGLQAGNDMTLLVYGSPANATATLLVDDNRAPTDASTAKLRLINGVTGSTGTLTLTANSALVASGVAPGAASSYVAAPISSTVAPNLTVISSAVQGNLLVNGTAGISQGRAYSVMVGGDVSSPTMLIR